MTLLCSQDRLRALSLRYPYDLTDAEWKRIEPIFDRFRFDEHDPRRLINAVFYLMKSGRQWRMLPDEFRPCQTVHYFRKWGKINLLQRLCDRTRRSARVAGGRDPSSSAAVIDTQSVDTERQGGPGRGRDPSKKVPRRKRHVIFDTLGLLLAVVPILRPPPGGRPALKNLPSTFDVNIVCLGEHELGSRPSGPRSSAQGSW
ncbi:transposase [Salinibacter ruber]|uniref:transposase n=1 Tax=Salinibacter ruber TaxID=146919 RepID=UPI003C6E02E8